MNRLAQVDKFIVLYGAWLEAMVTKHPEEYAFKLDRVPHVAEKMRNAFYEGSYNHDGRAIKATCKQLGIRHTRTAMEAYFNALDPDALSRSPLAPVTQETAVT